MNSVKDVLWLACQTLNILCYFTPSNSEKMAARFASVTSEEITQINDEAVHENTNKVTKFGLVVFESNGLSFSHGVYR